MVSVAVLSLRWLGQFWLRVQGLRFLIFSVVTPVVVLLKDFSKMAPI